MEAKPDYNKLSAAFAEDFLRNWKKEEEVRATLFLDDQPFATGTVAIAQELVKFRPKQPKQLDDVLHNVISLKIGMNEKQYFLKHSRFLLEISSESCWCFSCAENDDL